MVSNWKTCRDYPRYKVSDTGGVYDHHLGKVLDQQRNSDGYCVITLRNMVNKRITVRVHQLVAIEFIPNPENKLEINHKDGNKVNNTLSNLEWATHAENIQHAWDTGLLTSNPIRSKKLSDYHKDRNKGCINPNARAVVLINTGEVFETLTAAERKYNLCHCHLVHCCQQKNGAKTCGKDPITGEPLRWRYLSG